MKLSASSLNTNDCFVLVSPKETYVWLGKGSTGDEKEMAKRIATNTHPDPTVVYEGIGGTYNSCLEKYAQQINPKVGQWLWLSG